MWRGGEVDTIFGFEKEADALDWIKEKSQAWLFGGSRVLTADPVIERRHAGESTEQKARAGITRASGAVPISVTERRTIRRQCRLV